MYFVLIIAVIALDQLSKVLVRSHFVLGESKPLIEGVLHLTYIENTGAAFSSFQGQRLFLILLPLVLTIAFLAYLIVRLKKGGHWSELLASALIVGGGIGNLMDRIVRGSVTDFIDFRVWPIFNVADIAVCVGCGFLVLYVLVFDRKTVDRSSEQSHVNPSVGRYRDCRLPFQGSQIGEVDREEEVPPKGAEGMPPLQYGSIPAKRVRGGAEQSEAEGLK